MTEFITRNYGGKEYEIIVKTDNAEHYKATEDFARCLIDHAKPMTNADMIRAMTDEQLTEFIEDEPWACENYGTCKECPRRTRDSNCISIAEWLKRPAEV